MPKKQQAIVDERPLEAEQSQEVSRKDTIAAMWNNAKARLIEIQSDREALEELISDKQDQIGILQAQAEAADDFHQTALKAEEDAAAMVTRENARHQIAKGTPAEQERAQVLQSLIAALDSAKKSVEEAAKAKEEAERRAGVITVLREEIAEAHSKLAELASEEVDMVALKAEQHKLYGQALAEEIQAEIDAARQALIDEEERKAELERQFEAAQRRVKELSEWPDIREQVKAYGLKTAEPELNPTAHILQAYINYLQALIKWGYGARAFVNNGKQRLLEVLDLSPNATRALMEPGHYRQVIETDMLGRRFTKEVPTHQRIEIAEELLEEEKRRGPSYY